MDTGKYYAIETTIDNERHFFSRCFKDSDSGLPLIEWNIQPKYAARFKSKAGANNHIQVVIKMDGCKVVRHPNEARAPTPLDKFQHLAKNTKFNNNQN